MTTKTTYANSNWVQLATGATQLIFYPMGQFELFFGALASPPTAASGGIPLSRSKPFMTAGVAAFGGTVWARATLGSGESLHDAG